ncbi:hypothetical protein DH09_03210 [Bacillaceae bacterium JMAK1]|nr:hypothetical protein DH09_03210 [Bacillaceae bacterium JMAK1]
MRIRTWLFLSLLFVMVIPSLAVYSLYTLLTNWNAQQSLDEYLDFISTYQEIKEPLQNPDLYAFNPTIHEPLQETVEQVAQVTLYRNDGYVVYETTSDTIGTRQAELRDLYDGLYEGNMSYRYFTIKEPVFVNEEIVGFYEVRMQRDDRVEYVQSRSTAIIALSTGVFVVTGLLAWFQINRRVNKPINYLKNDMNRFVLDPKNMTTLEHPKNDEIGDLIKHFNYMKQEVVLAREEILQEQKEKEMMTAALSHDLKTPLTSVMAYTESMQQRALTKSETDHYLTIIRNKSIQMQRLIEDIHTFTLLKNQQSVEQKVTVNGQEFFEMLVDGYDELASRHEINLQKEVKIRDSYDVQVNHMMRLVDNLVSNAIRYTPPVGNLYIGIYDQQLPSWLYKPFVVDFSTHGVLIVQNDGATISEKESMKIFEAFYQSEESRSKKAGQHSGLGLSVAKMITENHGGNIQFIPVPNKGTILMSTFVKRKDYDEKDVDE